MLGVRGPLRAMDFSHTKLRLNRHPLSYAKVQRVVSAMVRNRRAFADIKQSAIYLDIGCGTNTHTDFCNLDYGWHPGIDVCWDITRGLPFPDHYVRGVFTEHCLEHFSLNTGLAILGEIHRIMRPRAVLRIVVPDGELYLRSYASRIAFPPLNARSQQRCAYRALRPIARTRRLRKNG